MRDKLAALQGKTVEEGQGGQAGKGKNKKGKDKDLPAADTDGDDES
jgi:hypothetical protein